MSVTTSFSDAPPATQLRPDTAALPTWQSLVGPALTGGLGTAVAMWCLWFVTHLPALGLPARVLGPALVLLVGLGGFITVRLAPGTRGWLVGAGTGLVAGLVNLLILGSKVSRPAGEAGELAGSSLVPAAGLVVVGFLGMCVALGALGGWAARATGAGGQPASARLWLSRLALVTAAAFLPLLLIGGLVTSTASGMAVPDWPGSYGANMFLYPISLMSHERIFLEHSHRLFGSMVGLATLALMVSVLVVGPGGRFGGAARAGLIVGMLALTAFAFFAGTAAANDTRQLAWAPALLAAGGAIALAALLIRGGEGSRLRLWAVGVFLLVCVQGFLGGVRVTENSAWLAMAHGVLAQLVFAAAVAVAVSLSPWADAADTSTADARDRRRKAMATGLLHGLILQLVLGAMYRHLGSMHPLWTHAGWSLVVVTFAALASFLAMSRRTGDAVDAPLGLLGKSVVGVVGLQFLLGWAAFAVVLMAPDRGGVPTHDTMDQVEAVPAWEALIRTAHQANGALLLGLAAALLTLTRRLWRARLAGRGAGEASR